MEGEKQRKMERLYERKEKKMKSDFVEFLMVALLCGGLMLSVLVGHMVIEYIAHNSSLGYPGGIIIGLLASAMMSYGVATFYNKHG